MPRRPCCSIGRRPGRRDAVIRDTAATLRQGSAPPAACAAAGARCSSPTGVHDVQRGTTSTSCPFPMIRRAFDDGRPAREGRRGFLPLDSQANERSNPTQIAMKRLLVGKDAQFRYWKAGVLSRRWVKKRCGRSELADSMRLYSQAALSLPIRREAIHGAAWGQATSPAATQGERHDSRPFAPSGRTQLPIWKSGAARTREIGRVEESEDGTHRDLGAWPLSGRLPNRPLSGYLKRLCSKSFQRN